MSFDGRDTAAIVALYTSGQNIGWSVAATAAFQLYDHIISVDREVAFFWGRPVNAASVLYFANRYFCLLRAMYFIVISALNPPAHSLEACIVQWHFGNTVEYLPLLTVAIFSTLRTYALTQRVLVAAIVFVLSLAPFLVNWVGHSWGISFEYNASGCLINLGGTAVTGKICERSIATTARLPLIISDLIVVIATWIKTYELGRSARRLGIRSLSDVLFKNGNIYALTLLFLNSLHWSLTLRSEFGAQNETGNSSLLSRIVDPISEVLVSRFLLDLQETAVSQTHQHSNFSIGSSMYFEGVIGSLSSSLPGPLDFEVDEGGEGSEVSDAGDIPVSSA